MAENQECFWELSPLSFEDQRLRDAYICVGKPVDQLPYSAEFDRLVSALGMQGTDDQRYFIFQRLLYLRGTNKMWRHVCNVPNSSARCKRAATSFCYSLLGSGGDYPIFTAPLLN
jgi:hypothetical protein